MNSVGPVVVDGLSPVDRRRRWQLVLPHRPYLLRIALSRGMSRDDAEDCAQEAMLRCVGFRTLDETRVLEFLATTTMRLCVDRHRAQTHDVKVSEKLVPWYAEEPSPEEATCDRSEATWVAGYVAALPESQRLALAAKADGLSCQEIATRMGLSYKAVESLLSRARAYVRAAVASAWVLAARLRRRGDTVPLDASAFAVAALVTIATLSPGGGAPRRQVALPPPAVVSGVATPVMQIPPPAVASGVPTVADPPPAAVRPSPAASRPGPPRMALPPLPVPTAIPPCDEVWVPHVSTCVPIDKYEPGAGLQRCLEYGVKVDGSGVYC